MLLRPGTSAASAERGEFDRAVKTGAYAVTAGRLPAVERKVLVSQRAFALAAAGRWIPASAMSRSVA